MCYGFLLDFPTEVCITGAESRIGKKREDLPWIEEKLDENFKQLIINFSKDKLPQIYKLLDKYKDTVKPLIIKYKEITSIKTRKIKLKN